MSRLNQSKLFNQDHVYCVYCPSSYLVLFTDQIPEELVCQIMPNCVHRDKCGPMQENNLLGGKQGFKIVIHHTSGLHCSLVCKLRNSKLEKVILLMSRNDVLG